MTIFYILRHKETKLIMPVFPTNRGYTHWDPIEKRRLEEAFPGPVARDLFDGETPRLFPSATSAKRARAAWAAGVTTVTRDADGYTDGLTTVAPRNPRSLDDIEVIPITMAWGLAQPAIDCEDKGVLDNDAG